MATQRSRKRPRRYVSALIAFTSLASPTIEVDALHNVCEDNPSYQTKRAIRCNQHLSCHGDGIKRAYGYDDADLLLLQWNCPATCGLCSKDTQQVAAPNSRLRVGGANEKGDRVNNGEYDAGESTSSYVIKRPALRPPPDNESAYNRFSANGDLTQSCHEGWHPYCQDDAMYYSKSKYCIITI
mmetsp:Transcript_19502/g.43404  ORF Transcript_19502/g.43404 Transcript_19502/m.43404 type:complete len:183 (-) Transcript_19502:355-903(-)